MSYHHVVLFTLALIVLVTKLVRLRTKPDSFQSELGSTFMVFATALLALLWIFDARGVTTAEIEWTLLGLSGAAVIAAIWATFLRTRA